MPTNLPAEAIAAERLYRAAKTTAEKVVHLQAYLSAIPKHKGTERLRAGLRRQLSKLKSTSQTKKGSSRRDSSFQIEREGAGCVVVVGPTNVGKSALVATLTNANPQVAAFPFTTWAPTPGMMQVKDTQVQLVDTPALNRDYVEPELLNLIRRADLILLVVDLQADPIGQLEDTIALLREHRIVPRHLMPRESDEERRISFIPLLVLVNKGDDESLDEDFIILCELLDGDWPLISASATTGRNLDRLKESVFESLEIMRVYSKPPGKPPDLTAPFVLPKGSTIEELAAKVHRDFFDQLRTVRVWGTGVHDGQMVPRDHVLHDGDIVELQI